MCHLASSGFFYDVSKTKMTLRRVSKKLNDFLTAAISPVKPLLSQYESIMKPRFQK